MSFSFPTSEVAMYEKQSEIGGKALDILGSDEWRWVEHHIFAAMQEQALNTLKNAKDEEARLRAQQMYIASTKPKELLEMLINEGQAAKEILKNISNQKDGDINE